MSEQHVQGADAVADLNNELKTRREKLASLREQGIPFPNDFRRDHTSDQLHADFDAKENEELEALNIEVSVAGRMMTRRIMGKASFVTLQDVGGRIQLYVARDDLPEGVYNEQFKKWDLGDILGAKGKLLTIKIVTILDLPAQVDIVLLLLKVKGESLISRHEVRAPRRVE